MTVVLLALLGFFLGAIPFAVLVARATVNVDLRDVGDGNPGATNVLKAGGTKWGALALLLEMGKGAVPVALANFVFGLDGLALVVVAVMPPLGHAFSPFLGFKGGKALAAIGGSFIGLTIWEIPTIGGIFLAFWFVFLEDSSWATVFTALSLLVYMVLTGASFEVLVTMVALLPLIVYKQWPELNHLPRMRRWFTSMGLPWHSLS